ncbi:carboxypeptidase-like regulatory domain-containing protein [Zobellia galactanivorans]|uniref:carboxypeptidase-like regulatory domain-containing protein n=1 Tax=Zobellia galactanivorans (strain DSM 12802 / CCUG 47099 / CIP 106680 / NCIMB 13871 / Dsij) TaxID=63186 RepID=UPI001C06A2F4|nr:carboxypeptidase-like regulatory domain-containing protein [Zobellia galactanivorans]MBU3027483.1 carboxypeptidase-like regulatory domain-containing protein [Zobellia galactanivorans]MDO6809412.1 carboxypeptidase-like regulatory domain-containing protein [Zobellia galactanivorans]
MKNILLFVVFLSVAAASWAQEIALTGMVKDSLGTGVDMANVIAINTETKGLESYGITNHAGLYKLKLKSGHQYTVKVSYLGFKTESFTFTASEVDAVKDIVMHEQANQLDEVEVTYEMPVSVKGDTIVYDTDSFVSGTEKKLKDVLENLPGIEINDDGQIEVEGKTVSKVMVEGKDFFDGDSKLAVENIPANALSKVEVLRNFNEVSQMKGLTNDDDNVALNIRLKEGKKNFWFGELTAGYGPDDRYLAHPKLFYYSPKYSINIITDLNNLGEVPFTRNDYRNFTGGFRNINARGGSSIATGADGLGLSTAQNNRANDIDTKFAAANFSYSPTESLDLSGFGIYSYTGTLMKSQRNTAYIASNDVENATTNTDQTVHLGLAKFSARYKPNADFQFDYDALLKQSDDNEKVDVLSVSDITDEISEVKKQKPLAVNQNLNLYYTLNEKNIFAVEAQHMYQDEDPFYEAIRNEFAYVDIFPVDEGQEGYNINQAKNVVTNKVDAKVDYYYVLGTKSNLNLTLGTTQSHQNFNSGIFQILDNEESFDMSGEAFGNDVTFNVSDLYLGFHYKVISGIFTFNPGVTLHQFNVKNEQLNTVVEDNLTSLLPDVYINAQLKKSENIRFNYRVTRSFTDVSKFAQGYVLNNYNSLYSGNRDLESALNHNLSLNFFSFNMFNFTNIFANIAYTKRIDALKSSADIIGINRVSTTINSNFEDESLSASGNYERTFGKIKASVRGNVAWSTTYNLVSNEQRMSNAFTQNYRGALSTNFKNAPNLEVGYRYTVNNYENGDLETTYFTSRPYARFDATFLKNFIFNVDYDYYNYTDKENTIENQYSFLEANLTYQKRDSRWEYGIKGTNLLNTTTLNRDSTNDLFFTTQAYFVQPRYLLFSIKYDL